MNSDVGASEIRLASRTVEGGQLRTEFSVPGVHCAHCISTIESAVSKLPGTQYARVNLSTRRLAVHWLSDESPPPVMETLADLGYEAHLFEDVAPQKDKELSRLLLALAVAGFCAMNIMLFSVSVWAGADAETRNLFHWISAILALPALAFSGRIFFLSAWKALRHGHTNMDVPISIGVILAFCLSAFDTFNHGPHAYFDASVTLLFFLLIGRTLDHVMRERARLAVRALAKLGARGANVFQPDGTTIYLPITEIEAGMNIALSAGERVPVDAEIEAGIADLDCSIVSGESAAIRVGPGAVVQAGTLNLTGSLRLRAIAAAQNSFLAEIVRLMEVAEGGRASYRRLADRVSRLYAPVVHLAALMTFVGWMLAAGDWHHSISVAIAVLIITCPCALGLAVPIVQVIAAKRLFEQGIMAKDGTATERLIQIDTVVFDKTGTLTTGQLSLTNRADIDPQHLALAAAIAKHSRHPVSKCIAAFATPDSAEFISVTEEPGSGLEAKAKTVTYRLGRADWALPSSSLHGVGEGTVLSADGRLLATLQFEDELRDDVANTIAALGRRGFDLLLLSGDRFDAVSELAERVGIATFTAQVLPGDKVARIQALAAAGHKVLMIGDGLNDAPALAAAYVSMAPGDAADIGRNAADFVFLRQSLSTILVAMDVSLASARLIRQNIGFAIAYNAIAVPIAIFGYVTPLVAAIAMSLSSILVVLNALRVRAVERSAAGRTPINASARLGMAK
jgi:Cu2+-exporting ATPase